MYVSFQDDDSISIFTVDPATGKLDWQAEVAVDGVVLFDRGYELSRQLTRLRRDIVAGRIVCRRVHGQTYWVQAA